LRFDCFQQALSKWAGRGLFIPLKPKTGLNGAPSNISGIKENDGGLICLLEFADDAQVG